MLSPIEAKPADIRLYGIDVFHVFLCRVGVIKPQVTDAAIFLCQTEVQTDALDVTDMQIAVGFRREASDDLVVWYSAFPKVVLNYLLDKVERFCILFVFHIHLPSILPKGFENLIF